jgi:hypothetical protein
MGNSFSKKSSIIKIKAAGEEDMDGLQDKFKQKPGLIIPKKEISVLFAHYRDDLKNVKKEAKKFSSPQTCWEELMIDIKKNPEYPRFRNYFYDYMINFIDTELNYYRKFSKAIKVLHKMHGKQETNESSRGIKFLLNCLKDSKLDKPKIKEIIEFYNADDNIEILNDKYLVHTYKM